MKNIQNTLMSQYANSPIICRLIEELNDCLDPAYTIENFYTLAFNLKTANDFGLDVWGRIVGISRNINIAPDELMRFGFSTRPQSFSPFNNYPFSAAGARFNAYQLSDDKFRLLILIKAASNIINATALNINKYLRLIFPDKRAYFLITGHMKCRYAFEFILTNFEKHIVYNLLPRPSGVLIDYKEVSPTGIFGFKGAHLQPFGQGVFA